MALNAEGVGVVGVDLGLRFGGGGYLGIGMGGGGGGEGCCCCGGGVCGREAKRLASGRLDITPLVLFL